MIELIISEDYRKYISEKDIQLSDWDKATLIYNHKMACHDEKIKALNELGEKTADNDLRKQISERIRQDKCYISDFKKNLGNAYYVLNTRISKQEDRYTQMGIFKSYELAYEAGKQRGVSFRIEKECFGGRYKKEDKNEVLGWIGYDGAGNIDNYFHLYKVDENNIDAGSRERFEGRYVDLPLYFRMGDIVRIVGTNLYGIVVVPQNDEEELEYRKFARTGDYSDFQITVNLIYNNKRYLSVFAHEHVPPTDIEYARFEETDSRKGFLEYMVRTFYQNSGTGDMEKDEGRIDAMLKKIEIIWRQYPNLPLGQLLLNVCGNCDLLSMGDEYLMNRLQKNEFPIDESD